MSVKVQQKTKSRLAVLKATHRRGASLNKKDMQLNPPRDGQVDLGNLGDMIGFLVRMAQIRLFEMFYEDFRSNKFGPGESSVLTAIHYNPGIRQGVLANALCIKRSNMAKMIARLNRKRLIKRSIPTLDKRAIQLNLSKSGEQLLAYLLPRMIEHNKRLEKAIPEPDRTQLIRSLKRISSYRGK
jgi:DNA-binding MarR family transcriptional regulator